MAYATVTLSGTYQTPDGTPHKGHVEIIPSERVIKDTTGDVILTGRVKVELDAQGAFSVVLPATDDPTLNPTGFGYTIAAKLHSSHPPAVSFSLPAALGATTVEDLTPVDPSTFAPTTTYAEKSALDAVAATIPTTPGDVNAEPAGLAQTTHNTLTATYSRGATVLPSSFYFAQKIIDAPTTGDRYAGLPGTGTTKGGALVVAWRVGPKHDMSGAGNTPGKLYVSRSDDGGRTWTPRVEIVDLTGQGIDPRDPNIMRFGDDTRLWLSFSGLLDGNVRTPGLYVSYSDDGGTTWATPVSVYGTASSGTGFQQIADGTYYWPIFRDPGTGFIRATSLMAADPLGPWTPGSDASTIDGTNEWDFVQYADNNWIGAVRGPSGGTDQLRIVQSTDQGATWSTPTTLNTIGGATYDGWPTLRSADDGTVLLFVRAQGKGQRVVRCSDPAWPLDPTNWAEPGIGGEAMAQLDFIDPNNMVGCFKPVRLGDAWVGAYMAEIDRPNEVAEVRFGGLTERSIQTYVSRINGPEKQADGSPVGYTTLTTPSRVVVHTSGGFYRIKWQAETYTTGNNTGDFQVDVFVDGVITGNWVGGGMLGLNQNTNAVPVVNGGYSFQREGVVRLDPGAHTIELRFRQSITTTGRTWRNRVLIVEPVA